MRKIIVNTTETEVKEYTEMLNGGIFERRAFEIDGETKEGVLIGNDEMFDNDGFYQLFAADDGNVYECYYAIEDEDGEPIELDSIDYDQPENIVLSKDFRVEQ